MATIYYDPEKDNLVPVKKTVKVKKLNIFQRIVYGDDAFSFWGQIALYILLTAGVIALSLICLYGWICGLANGWWLFWIILWVAGGFFYSVAMMWVAQVDAIFYSI